MAKREEKAKKPVYAVAIGDVRASVWENLNDSRRYFSVTLARRYKDGDQWHMTNSLRGVSDSLHAIHALRKVVEGISNLEQGIEAGEEAKSHE